MSVPMSVPNLPTKNYNNNHAYDMQKLHHNYIFPLGKSIKNPHIVAASFSENHDEDARPHVTIKVANSTFWTLLDSGASISLITKKAIDHVATYLDLPCQKHKMFV